MKTRRMTIMTAVLVVGLVLSLDVRLSAARGEEPVFNPVDGRMVFTVPGSLADPEPLARFIEEDDALLVPLPFLEPAPEAFFRDLDDEWISGYGIVARPLGYCWMFAKRAPAASLKRYLAATTGSGRLVLTVMKPYRRVAAHPAPTPASTAGPILSVAASAPVAVPAATVAVTDGREAAPTGEMEKLSRLNQLIAAKNDCETPKAPTGSPSFLASGIRMAVVLCVLLALFLLLAGALKQRLKRLGGGSGNGRGLVRVLRTVPLGMKRQIMFIEIAGEVLVVGASGEQLSLLTRIEDPVQIEELRFAAGSVRGAARPGGFAGSLRAAWRRPLAQTSVRPAAGSDREPRRDSPFEASRKTPINEDLYGQVVDQIKQRLQDLPRL